MMYEDNSNLFAVDTTGVDKMGGFEVYPSGLYNAILTSASKKPTKDGNGAFIECVYQFIDGDYAGKKFTSRMNLWNANSQAVDIAKRELKSLRAATGNHDQESNLAAFVNKPVLLNISAKARKDDPTKAENNLVSIEPYTGAPSQVAAVATPAPQYQPTPQQQMPFAQQPMQQRPAPAMQPQPPAFQPNGAATPPWMQGAR